MKRNFAPHKEWVDDKGGITASASIKDSLALDGVNSKYEQYKRETEKLLHADDNNYFDSEERKNHKLSRNERILDDMLRAEREKIIGNKHTYFDYPAANMFYKVRNNIEKTQSYKIFQKLPKGGNLHIHTSSAWDARDMINFLKNEFQYKENVYVYFGDDIRLEGSSLKLVNGQLLYLTNSDLIKVFGYLLSKFNKEHETSFKGGIKSIVQLSNEEIEYEIELITFSNTKKMDEVDYIWDEFNNVFSRVYAILNVKNFYSEYYYHSFETLYADNIDYCELRFGTTVFTDSNDVMLRELFGLIGFLEVIKKAPPEDSIDEIHRVYMRFKKEHPDFKLKLIISTSRKNEPNDAVVRMMREAETWKAKYKDDNNDFIIGFDFVSEEDLNYKTDCYAKIILENNINIPFYFHDGESNWADDDNVIAAVCLNTKRIGHGFNLYRFPAVLDKVVKDKICLEICPISNQLLRYSPDLRSHPIGEYMKRGVPFVICSDDPQIFNDKGLSYDFWEFYYSQLVDLVSIKQAIRNSYTYSGMSEAEKKRAISNWECKWNQAVNNIVSKNISACAAMLEKYYQSDNESFALDDEDMQLWQDYYAPMLSEKAICKESAEKISNGNFNKEDCMDIMTEIFKVLATENGSDISDQVKSEDDSNIGLPENTCEYYMSLYFNQAWE